MCFCSMNSSLLFIQLIVILVPFTMALFYLAGFNEIIERLRIFNGLFVDSSHDTQYLSMEKCHANTNVSIA